MKQKTKQLLFEIAVALGVLAAISLAVLGAYLLSIANAVMV